MKSKNVVIKAESGHIQISPYGFFLYAKDFFDAAKAFKRLKLYSPVPYFLYCRSMELALKAFLLGKGVPKEDLPKKNLYGHDLEKILKKAQEKDLREFVKITPEQEKEILKANKYYVDKKVGGFEYFDVHKVAKGYPELPNLLLLEKTAAELVTNLKSFCLNAAQIKKTA